MYNLLARLESDSITETIRDGDLARRLLNPSAHEQRRLTRLVWKPPPAIGHDTDYWEPELCDGLLLTHSGLSIRPHTSADSCATLASSSPEPSRNTGTSIGILKCRAVFGETIG